MSDKYSKFMTKVCTPKLDRLLKRGFTEVITSLRKDKVFTVDFKWYGDNKKLMSRMESFSTWHGAVTYAAILGQQKTPRIRHIGIIKAVDEVVSWRYDQ